MAGTCGTTKADGLPSRSRDMSAFPRIKSEFRRNSLLAHPASLDKLRRLVVDGVQSEPVSPE